jgi:octaprenyl-diphosphate synthase
MKDVAEDRVPTSATLRVLYAPIQQELHQVEELISRELCSEYPFVDRLVKYGVRLGGKRLRPALVLLAGQACAPLRQDHLVLAAAVEMIHTATLIHDDVLDEATLRRHIDTVNSRWDNETSVLLGDYLLARCLCLVSSVETTFACRTIAEASRAMCEGELRQIASRGDYGLTEQDYLGIITGKTAALTACCCQLGAHYGAADAAAEAALTEYGRYLGIAFQIADDLLDVLGDEATAGKSLGTDLAKQKSTLPLIRVLQQTSQAERREVVTLLSGTGNHRRDALRPWLERFDAIAYAQDKAQWYARRAAAELDALPASPTRQAMQSLTEFVVTRHH